MLQSLPCLIRQFKLSPYTCPLSLLGSYKGNDWGQYIHYSTRTDRSILLWRGDTLELSLIGLIDKQPYGCRHNDTIRVLDGKIVIQGYLPLLEGMTHQINHTIHSAPPVLTTPDYAGFLLVRRAYTNSVI